jgi:long-subunit fatty acid transport protein
VVSTGSLGLDMDINVAPMMLGTTVGAAYAITPKVSLALGGRYYYASSAIDLKYNAETFRTEASGSGFGIVTGVDVRPVDKLNIALQFIWNSPLETENLTQRAEGTTGAIGELIFPKGAKNKVQLPMLLALGVSYEALPRLKLEVDGTFYFQGHNDRGLVTDQASPQKGKSVSDFYGLGYELGIACEYGILPNRLTVSAGYTFGNDGQQRAVRDELSYYLNYHQIGFGASVRIFDQLQVTAGYMVAILLGGGKSYDLAKSFHDSPTHFFALGLKGRFPL